MNVASRGRVIVEPVVARLLAAGMSQREIARALGIGDSRLARWMKHHGLVTKRAGHPRAVEPECVIPPHPMVATRLLAKGISETGGAGDVDVPFSRSP